MDQEVSISDLIYNFDKCLSCLYDQDIYDFDNLKNIRLKYSIKEIDTSLPVIRESTEIYLTILSCLSNIKNFLIILGENETDNEILEKISKKYQQIYISKSGKNCLPPDADGVDRRSEIFFDEFEGSVFRHYNFLTTNVRNNTWKKIIKGDYRIEQFLFMVELKLFKYLQSTKNKHENLNLSSFTISKMRHHYEEILYVSEKKFESKVTMIYFLENISRIYGVIIKQQESNIILPGDKNSLIFYDSSIDCELVYPPKEISQDIVNKYPRYIIKCHFN